MRTAADFRSHNGIKAPNCFEGNDTAGGAWRALPLAPSLREHEVAAPRSTGGDGFGRGAHGCPTLVAPLLIPFVSRTGCFPWDAPWDAFLSLRSRKRGCAALAWWRGGQQEGSPSCGHTSQQVTGGVPDKSAASSAPSE